MGDGEFLRQRWWLVTAPDVDLAPSAYSFIVVVYLVLSLQIDCPARRHGRLVKVEVIGLEGEAAEDWGNGISLAIR